ncbi:MAG TPA: prepilin-type N-terminal cleavage/methylation domain-containing protein [Planctomycetota bacterium]|nr:prepilin-type N-terminal cleavage/methylation domain-containing protein [Planctomycetota bacterium]
MNARTQAGFTLMEVMLVMAVLTTMMVAVWNGTAMVTSTTEANSASAEVITQARRYVDRLGRMLRPAKMSTLMMRANAADVSAGRAVAVGDWIEPTDLVWRNGIQFISASGLLSMNAALDTVQRSIIFKRDASEIANGIDDDGDGLVDEGRISLLENGEQIDLLLKVEDCSFQLDGRLLAIRVRCAQRDGKGRVYRTNVTQHYYLRNN